MRILHVGYGFRPWRSGGLIAYAEDVMEGQAAAGHAVAYLFRGRHHPGRADDRLGARERRGVAMHEILNSSLVFGGDTGTLTPEADLHHPPSEAHFAAVLESFRPDVVHLQELIGLPSSVIDLARGRGVPVVATLQDYLPLCPVLKLYDVDGERCERTWVGAQCARCSHAAPAGRGALARKTVDYELADRFGADRVAPFVAGVARGRRLAGRASRLAQAARDASTPGPVPAAPARTADPRSYQARRDANVERLSSVDALVAQSHRLAEIYRSLGVRGERMEVMQLTLAHLDGMTARAFEPGSGPLRFAVVNAAASVEKGSEVVIGALELLTRGGLVGRFRLRVLGYIPDDAWKRLSRFAEVELPGAYDPTEIDERLEGVDVGIVPSVWEEAYGYVGPEFLAKGIPVIGNARGGIVDYTRDGETGWVNEAADAEGLAAIMRRLVADPGEVRLRNRWILDHRSQLIKRLPDHLTELDALYARVVAGAGRPAGPAR